MNELLDKQRSQVWSLHMHINKSWLQKCRRGGRERKEKEPNLMVYVQVNLNRIKTTKERRQLRIKYEYYYELKI